MAASITITRALNEQGGDVDALLVSAFMQNSIEFTFNKDAVLTGTYATVTINSIPFRAVLKTPNITTNTDLYELDLTNILPFYLGFPPTSNTVTGLTKDLVMVINGYNSAGASIATATHETIKLSFGYNLIGIVGGLDYVYESGRMFYSNAVYYNGKISFYFSSTSGSKSLVIGGVSHSYSLVNGYNILVLDASQKINGTLTESDGLSIPLIYKAQTYSTTEVEIAWLNMDGCWNYWNFRYLGKNTAVANSKTIPVYGSTNALMYAKTVDLGKDKKVQLSFDTIAVDITHYAQLCEIAESPRVIYSGRVYRVIQCNSSVSNNKQNLHFSLTLETEENAVSY